MLHVTAHLLLFGHEEIEHEAVLRERFRLSQQHLQPTPPARAVVRQRLVAPRPGARLDEAVREKFLAIIRAENIYEKVDRIRRRMIE